MEQFIEAIVRLETSLDLGMVEEIVRTAARPRGYDKFVMFTTALTQDDPVEAVLWIEGDWFGNGQDVDVTTYVRHCPVTRHVLQTAEPFFWTKTLSARGERYRVTQYPRGPGIHGLQVPLFGRTGLEGAMSFGGETIDASPAVRVALASLAAAAFRAARRFDEVDKAPRPTHLSAREREVLRWTAAGRRQTDIAAKLGLSERTIENHLRRVRMRLGAATTAQAVSLAIREGLMDAEPRERMS